jgi:hypothetical protein
LLFVAIRETLIFLGWRNWIETIDWVAALMSAIAAASVLVSLHSRESAANKQPYLSLKQRIGTGLVLLFGFVIYTRIVIS